MPEKSYSLQIVTSYTGKYKCGTEEKQNLMDPWTQSPLCDATGFTKGLIFVIILSSLLLLCLILNWSLIQCGGCTHRCLQTLGTWSPGEQLYGQGRMLVCPFMTTTLLWVRAGCLLPCLSGRVCSELEDADNKSTWRDPEPRLRTGRINNTSTAFPSLSVHFFITCVSTK